MTIKKKRFRRVLVCSNCHRKKSKCDRSQPCSSCVRSNIHDTCSYSSELEVVANTNRVEKDKVSNDTLLNLIKTVEGIKSSLSSNNSPHGSYVEDEIEDNEADMFSIRKALNTDRQGNCRIMFTKSLMGLFTMVSGDPAAKLFYKCLIQLQTYEWFENSVYGLDGDAGINLESLDTYRVEYFGLKYIPKISTENFNDVDLIKSSISLYADKIGVIYSQSNFSKLDLIIKQIENFLPSTKIIQRVLDIYFENRFLGQEFIAEEDFRTNINKILQSDKQFTHVTIQSKNDLLATTILLMILRITYLSLKSPFSSNNEISGKDYLFCFQEFPIPLNVLELVESVLNSVNVISDATINTFQALSLRFLYRLSAPEQEIFGNPLDIGALFSQVVQVARALHLNEDVTFSQTWGQPDNKIKPGNYARSVWVYLMQLDIYVCTFLNGSLTINSNDSNLLLPQLEEGNSLDDEMPKHVTLIAPVIRAAHVLCEESFPIGASINVNKLIRMISSLEIQLENSCGKLEDYFVALNEKYDWRKLSKFSCLLIIKCLLLCYYYALYVYFETKSNSNKSFYFGKKLMEITFLEFSCIQEGLFIRCEEYFGTGSWLTLCTPSLLCNSLQLICSRISVRFSFTIAKLQQSNTKNNVFKSQFLVSLRSKMLSYQKFSLSFSRFLSKYLSNAWWWYKACKYGERLFHTMENSNFKIPEEVIITFSMAELQRWDEDLNDSLVKIEYFKSIFKHNVESEQEEENSNIKTLVEAMQIDKLWLGINYIQNLNKETEFEWLVHRKSNVAEANFEFDPSQAHFDVMLLIHELPYL